MNKIGQIDENLVGSNLINLTLGMHPQNQQQCYLK